MTAPGFVSPNAVRRFAVESLSRASSQVRDDLRTDPVLRYVLLLSAVFSTFGIWHSLPNFATRDERWRVVDPIEPIGFVLADPSLAALREGIVFWRPYGATMYLFGLTALPVVLFVLATGRSSILAAVAQHEPRGYWEYWNEAPAWFWSGITLLGRLANVLFAVGCVYLMYRIGTALRDRRTGRLAAVSLSLTWGFVVLAHEVGEDVPALFFLLLAFYLAVRYVETGVDRSFYAGCLAGGFAMALKPTAGLAAILLGLAVLLRARRVGTPVRRAVTDSRLPWIGAGLGLAVVVLGHPGNLVGAPEQFVGRFGYGFINKRTPHYWVTAPSWWWIARGYLHAFGLPLAVGIVCGIVAVPWSFRDRSTSTDGVLLATAGIVVGLLVFSQWSYVRAHHLLPTVPFLLLVLAVALARAVDERGSVARLAVAGLLLTSALYVGVGDLAYADQPRDQARSWLADNAAENATVEVYVNDPQDAAVPHGTSVYHVADRWMRVDGERRHPYPEAWIRAMPHRCPDYIHLSYQSGLQHVAPPHYADRFSLPENPRLREYFQDLLAADTYPYEVAAEFGPRPRFVDGRDARTPLEELAYAAVNPRSIQYGDPQDFGVNQYTLLVERTGPCDSETTSPL